MDSSPIIIIVRSVPNHVSTQFALVHDFRIKDLGDISLKLK